MIKVLLIALFVSQPLLAIAQSNSREQPPLLPPQAEIVAGVLVPVPSEVFGSLDKFANSNWKSVQRRDLARSSPGGDQAQTALRLGAVIAEGFIAVEAEDNSEVRDIGRTVLTLARALGVEQSVLRRSNSIIEHADKGQWGMVRKEWSSINSDVKKAMVKIESEPVAQLVSYGGWLRGTEALTTLVLQHYSPESAALLRQPAVLAYFDEHLGELNGRFKENAIVAQSKVVILELRRLTGQPNDAQISETEVKDIRSIVMGAVKAIQIDGRSVFGAGSALLRAEE